MNKNNQDYSYSSSLINFFENTVRARLSEHDLKILDLGCGFYSLFEDVLNLNAEITAIDFSNIAIEKALQSKKGSKICYKEAGILDAQYFSEAKYDLIFDSHCINCIESNEERELAIKNIYSSLKKGGLLASELMIQPEIGFVSMPLKMIQSSIQIEKEILSRGFKILYFMVSRDSGFTSMINGNEIKCDLLKLIAEK